MINPRKGYNKSSVPREPYEPDLIKRTIKKMEKSLGKRKMLLDYLIKKYPKVIGSQKIRERIEQCCSKLIFRHYPHIKKHKLKSANFCNYHKVCLACATKRSILLMRKLYKFIAQNNLAHKHWYSIVLTIRHKKRHSLEELMEKMIELRTTIGIRSKNGKRPDQKNKSFFAQFDGMITSLEVTNGKYLEVDNGRHPHIHLLACSDVKIQTDYKKYDRSVYTNDDFIEERKELTSKWKDTSNDSYSVNIEKITVNNAQTNQKKVMEVFKYAVKAISMDFEDHAELIALLHEKKYRLITTHGIFYGMKLDPTANEYANIDMKYLEIGYEMDTETTTYEKTSSSAPIMISKGEKY